MSATDNLGPHLLGRIPSTPDARDYKMSRFLSEDALVAALKGVAASHWESRAIKRWAELVTARLVALTPAPTPTPDPIPIPVPVPTPEPTPTPVPESLVEWACLINLDQGQTSHCVGDGWADWHNSDPVAGGYTQADADSIYYEAKAIDGEPGQEDGSQVRSGAKAMQNRGRLSAYAFASSLADVRAWLRTKGPVVFGTNWTTDMFTPDGNGYIAPTGQVEGGHCFLALADIPEEDAIMFLNSWGTEWGLSGYFKMKTADVATLLGQEGEACAAVELAA